MYPPDPSSMKVCTMGGAVAENQLFFLSRSGRGVTVASPGFVETEALEYLSPLAYPQNTLELPSNNLQPERGVGDDVTRSVNLPCRPDNTSLGEIISVAFINGAWTYEQWPVDDYTGPP